jgi:molybdopterin/thiamine biosynthesis adenylyltransferase/rhodanese-related sulfurtransferase
MSGSRGKMRESPHQSDREGRFRADCPGDCSSNIILGTVERVVRKKSWTTPSFGSIGKRNGEGAMKSYKESIEEARQLVEEISVRETHELLHGKTREVAIVDIRSREQMSLGSIKGAALIPADELERAANHLFPDKKKPLILYCAAGNRSLLTGLVLKRMGYVDVKSLAGGMKAWNEAGFEIDNQTLFTRDQLVHYSRQMLLPEVGVDGQTLLSRARVLIVGAGGLGSPAALYLAGSGVGTMGIVDFDVVDASNLNRQIIHGFAAVGKAKTESAREGIERINPDVEVLTFDERLTWSNAAGIVSQFDVILDGSDNFQTKYLLNDAAFFAGKPYVFGAAVRTEGQASVFHAKAGGPCLRCMLPQPPPQEMVPT